jgi:hypothetical protein
MIEKQTKRGPASHASSLTMANDPSLIVKVQAVGLCGEQANEYEGRDYDVDDGDQAAFLRVSPSSPSRQSSRSSFCNEDDGDVRSSVNSDYYGAQNEFSYDYDIVDIVRSVSPLCVCECPCVPVSVCFCVCYLSVCMPLTLPVSLRLSFSTCMNTCLLSCVHGYIHALCIFMHFARICATASVRICYTQTHIHT